MFLLIQQLITFKSMSSTQAEKRSAAAAAHEAMINMIYDPDLPVNVRLIMAQMYLPSLVSALTNNTNNTNTTTTTVNNTPPPTVNKSKSQASTTEKEADKPTEPPSGIWPHARASHAAPMTDFAKQLD